MANIVLASEYTTWWGVGVPIILGVVMDLYGRGGVNKTTKTIKSLTANYSSSRSSSEK